MTIVAVASEDAELASKLRDDLGLSYVQLAVDPTLAAIEAWGVRHDGEEMAVPATFILAADGTVTWRYVGESMTDRPTSEGLLQFFE